MKKRLKMLLLCVGFFLISACGKEERIYGISFTNEVYANEGLPPKTHHTQDSYRDLSEMGINTVRFYLNYGLFEDDEDPYTYKESGFEWIEENIEWAKKNNIRLILNMHYPQGGYQSNALGSELWSDVENQKRFIALWREIARRYAKEKTILGYGLLNEPMVLAKESFEESVMQWEELAQKTCDEIREVDRTHCIFIERIQGIIGLEKFEWNYDYRDERNFIDIEDANYVYEFHYYNPIELTHQDIAWYENQRGYLSEEEKEQEKRDWSAQVKQELEYYVSIGKKRGIPMYLGEVGTSVYSLENSTEGETWLRSILEISKENELGITIHCYHEADGFGLYMDLADELPKTLNKKMFEIIRDGK